MMSPLYGFFSRFSANSTQREMVMLIVIIFGLVSFGLHQLSNQEVSQINRFRSSNSVNGPSHYNSMSRHVVKNTSDPLSLGITSKDSDNSDKKGIVRESTAVSNTIKRILWYTRPKYLLSTDKGELRPLKACPELSCKETTDKDLISQADAVIFDVHRGIKDLPSKRPNQVWIFFAQESPNNILENLKTSKYRNKFNWTCTYRKDSDIWMPYGLIEKRSQLPQKDYNKIVIKKSKMASWLVSHCNVSSQRREYVQLLEDNGIKTEILGKCGKTQCPRTINGHAKCRNILAGEYSFYLGFENSLCKDYVTEKLFDYYNEDIILVVRGGKENYKQYPPGIFINTEDFKNVSELASYMKDLHNNKTKYVEFLKRKDAYRVIEETFTYRLTKEPNFTHFHYLSEPMCNMCRKLLEGESEPKVYEDIYSWFSQDVCHTPTDLK